MYLSGFCHGFVQPQIGYAYGTSMTAERAVKAVENACIKSFHSVLKKGEIIFLLIKIKRSPQSNL
jgi:hypothetical protein